MHSEERHTLVHSPALRPEDWLRFVQLPPFPNQWDRLGLGDDALRSLEVLIMAAPRMFPVVRGTDGLRKLRFSPPDLAAGKSGGFRVFYLFLEEFSMVILWAIIHKAEAENLTKAEQNAIRAQVQRVRLLLERGMIR